MPILVKKIVSVIEIIAGVFFLLVGMICVEEWFRDPAYAADMEISGLIMCLVVGALGLLLLVFGVRTIRLACLFQAYKDAVEDSKDGFIPEIAAVLGKDADKVRKNLDRMCKKKYFEDAYVDEKANLFIRKNKGNQKIGNPSFRKQEQSLGEDFVTVRCKGCGGVNKLPRGAVWECEYCGSPVKGE